MFGRPTMGGAAKAATRLRAYGRVRVPHRGGLVLAINHLHWIDIPIVGQASPRNIDFVAKIEAFKLPALGEFIRLFGTIAIRRGESDREAVRLMRQSARNGRTVGVFVEGTRQKSGHPGRAQPGAAMVALQEDVPVIPVAIYGTQFWKPGNFAPCSIAFGEPLAFERAAAERARLQGGDRRDRAADPRALRLARRHAPARTAARRRAPAVSTANELKGTVAIVGFPNVGKSTLVNRLTGSRAAVVHASRERRATARSSSASGTARSSSSSTPAASISPTATRITTAIARQAKAAIADADLVLFVVDARAGVTPGDEELAELLRAAHKPVLLLANKIDDPAQEGLALELHRLGFGEPVPISGLHGTNVGDLLDQIIELLPGSSRRPVSEDAIRVAILGRPNVGKSSLFNRLVGEERTIVSDVPGTTRDSIDTVVERDGRTFVLVDTAGLRRKRRQRQGIDYYSELRALDAAERADVALVLIDASQGIVEGDITAVEVARKAHCATLVVLSKWDIGTVTIEEVRPELQRRLRQRPPFITVSAHTGRGVARLLDRIAELFDKYADRIPTAGAQPLPRRAARGAPGAVEGQPAPQPALRRAGRVAPAALPLHRQRPGSRHARLRLLGREPAARALRARRRAGRDRLPEADVKVVVVGGGAWGTAFTGLLRGRGHDVTLASTRHDRRPAAPYESRPELVVLAVPEPSSFSRARSPARATPAPRRCSASSRGSTRQTGERLSTLVEGRPVAVLSGPNMAEEVASACPARR